MRVLIDTNVYISYLLIPFGNRAPNLIIEAARRGVIIPLISDRLLSELVRRIATKPYLSDRIAQAQLAGLVDALFTVGDRMSPLPDELPPVGQDRKDDCIFAHAVIERPFCIVSGDGGMQRVGEIDGIPILSPARFVQLLSELGILEFDQNGDGT